jgi:hypothetical protein
MFYGEYGPPSGGLTEGARPPMPGATNGVR